MSSGEAKRQSQPGCVQVMSLRKPRALQLPVCVRPARRALAAARAPSCLKRVLQQNSKQPRKLATTCAWAEKSPIPIRLLPDPLFGNCLAEVLQSPPPTQPQDVKADNRRVAVPPYPESLTASKTNKPHRHDQALLQKPQPRPVQTPNHPQLPVITSQAFSQPARASLELLARQAGGNRFISRMNGISLRGRLAQAVRFVQASLITGPSLQISESLYKLAQSAASAGLPSGWLAGLGQRLSRRFNPRMENAGNFNDYPSGLRSVGSDGESTVNVPGWAAQAISVDPNGPRVPLEVLLRLIGEAENTSTLPDGGSGSEQDKTTKAPLLNSPAEASASGMPAWDAPFSTTPRGEAPSPNLTSPPGGQQGFYPQSGSLPMPGAGQPNFRPLIAPPTAVDAPPTLLPPQSVFDAPTPYASAAARQTALHDESSLIEEDLDVLAAKIKRILDDEARRYGIQV